MSNIPRLSPWPYDRSGTRRADGLDLSVKIQGPSGWFDLEDGVHYAIHGDSFAEYAQTWRKREVNSEWVEGTFPVSAVRENVTEPLVVWVKGPTDSELQLYKGKLIEAIEQLSWMLMVRFTDSAEYWQCWASDYSVQTQREFRHATLAVVRATVSRLPAKDYVDATSDEQ